MSNATKGKTAMEMNRITISVISILITLTMAISAFAYQTGEFNNEIRNIKEQQIIIKKEFKEDISKVEQIKADKVVVELMMKKLDESIADNYKQHILIMEKLDKIIEKK